MRTALIAGNWKMNTTVNEARTLVAQLRPALDSIKGVDKLICPPFISLVAVADMLAGGTIGLGAQNMYFEDKGAFTGEISPLMLAGLCSHVILGHSERRHIFGEGDQLVARKLKSALRLKLKPILCVGEKLPDRENGQTREVIDRQLASALTGLEELGDLVIAYEPVWAIGTGRAATSEQAQEVICFIRQTLAARCGQDVAATVRILYGGSVTTANIAELMRMPDIDGALVGGASLKAGDFIGLCYQAAAIRNSL